MCQNYRSANEWGMHTHNPKSFKCLTLLARENELSGVHALGGSQKGVDSLELVRVLELDLGNGSTSARVVDNVFHNTFDVAVSLGIVVLLHGHRALSASGVGLIHRALTLSLRENDFSHFVLKGEEI